MRGMCSICTVEMWFIICAFQHVYCTIMRFLLVEGWEKVAARLVGVA